VTCTCLVWYKFQAISLNGSSESVEILPGGLDDWQSIEIPAESRRPSTDFPYVLVEGNLGIPNKVARQLYLSAIALPWRSLREPQTAITATTLILILNPAHQTALNARKRLITNGHIHPEKELRYSELLLRGFIDCAKQSIIWEHRRWCLIRVYGRIGKIAYLYPALEHWASVEEAQMFPDMGSDDIRKEIGIVYHTCETYPRNYHAWNYLHWLINGTFSSVYRHLSDETGRRDFLRVLVDAYAELRAWVECHPSDYSAIHQLCQMQTIMDHLRAVEVLIKDVGKESHSTLAGHCLSLLSSFPSHESLWLYLRLALKDKPRSHIPDRVESDLNSNPHAARLLAWSRRGST
jgi:protein prenyltransferase alpha subunit repeat containing protein 1